MDLSTALILVDVQNDYFPGGKMELVGSLDAGQKAQTLLKIFRQQKLPLIHIQHIATRPGATFFLPNTSGADINDLVHPLNGETIIQKHFPNSFRETQLLEYLQKLNIKKVVIAGMMTHMCVDATTRAANDYGFDCMLVYDACATRDLKFAATTVPAAHVHAAFLSALGSYAKVISTDELVAEYF